MVDKVCHIPNRLFLCGSASTLEHFVLSNSQDTYTAYGLICKLHAAVLPPEQRSLSLLTIIDDLEAELSNRIPALTSFANKPAATPASIVADLIGELTYARSVAPSAPGAAAAPHGSAVLTSSSFDDATTKSSVFQALAASVLSAPLGGIQDQIDLLAMGFNGQRVVAVRCLLSVTANGDPLSSKHAALQLLNSYRSVRHLYFNYCLAVDTASGAVPARLSHFCFATPTTAGLMDQFLCL